MKATSLFLDGQKQKKRYKILVDGEPVWLTYSNFKLLTLLALSKTKGEQSMKLPLTHYGQMMARLREQSGLTITPHAHGWGTGYRLEVPSECIGYDYSSLKSFQDNDITDRIAT